MPTEDYARGSREFWIEALAEHASIVGSAAETEAAQQNMTEYQTGTVSSIVYPTTLAQVETLVALANTHQLSLFPVSTGKNWGLGSQLPATGTATVVNLVRMKQILAVNERFRYAIIEPGVTQGELYAHLRDHHPGLMLAPTGSAMDTSVVGNVLDRGASIRGHRYLDLRGVEAVLGNGRTLRTGGWHYPEVEANGVPVQYYEPGVGPDITGMFSQSNLGIVTKMVVRLRPRRPERIFTLVFESEHLERLGESVFELTEDDLLDTGCLITNLKDPRTHYGAGEYGTRWFAAARIKTADLAWEASQARLQEHFADLGTLQFWDTETTYPEEQLPTPYVNVLLKMHRGEPTNHSMHTLWQMSGQPYQEGVNVDVAPDIKGFVCALPAVPLSGPWFNRIIDCVMGVSERVGVDPYFNFLTFTPHSCEGFFRVFFDRHDPQAVARVHQWNREAHEALQAIGIIPYRGNVRDLPVSYGQNDPFWHTITDLKTALDPNGILAPGKYAPS